MAVGSALHPIWDGLRQQDHSNCEKERNSDSSTLQTDVHIFKNRNRNRNVKWNAFIFPQRNWGTALLGMWANHDWIKGEGGAERRMNHALLVTQDYRKEMTALPQEFIFFLVEAAATLVIDAKETTLERAGLALHLLFFVTAHRERKCFIYFCRLLSP